MVLTQEILTDIRILSNMLCLVSICVAMKAYWGSLFKKKKKDLFSSEFYRLRSSRTWPRLWARDFMLHGSTVESFQGEVAMCKQELKNLRDVLALS